MPAEAKVQRTSLYDAHVAAGAKMIPFAGWDMPVQYTSIIQEHQAVRKAAGLFDISHMGEVRVTGPDAVSCLNFALSNEVARIPVGGSQYDLLLNAQGGTLDDLFVYRIGPEEFLLVVNASQAEQDFGILSERQRGRVKLCNESAQTAAVALQGPASATILNSWLRQSSASRLGHHAIAEFDSPCGSIWIARTGYTGEDGFEILLPNRHAPDLWAGLLQAGASQGLVPCGLGARDTLRLESCYPLYGHELSPDISPLEAGLRIFVDLGKPDFVGRDALLRQQAAGVARHSVALTGKPGQPPPRAGYGVSANGKRIGTVTSGSQSPLLQVGIGLALVETASARIGNSVDIEIRGKYVPMTIVKKPIYRRTP